MRPEDIEMEAARRAMKAGLGVSEWEACLLPDEVFALMRAYKVRCEALATDRDGWKRRARELESLCSDRL